MTPTRRYPIGAELQPGGGTHFRVWAPASSSVAVELVDESGKASSAHPLAAERDGYFAGQVTPANAGALYRLRLPREAFSDPASRFQPLGPRGPSQVIEPTFRWTDAAWRGHASEDLVIYEVHLGTFTREGTWRAAAEQLGELARIGITALEIMPIADFPGRFGWGYDGVNLFAPSRLYGSPDDARSFISTAHRLGLAVILDVVYNHLGPDGSALRDFSPQYVSEKYRNEWGDSLNFDGGSSGPVREFFITNARYWIEEFHFDGLRLDATQQIFDASPTHLLEEITESVRKAAPGRKTFVVAENEPQNARIARSRAEGGYGLDAIWNDDFHHTSMVAATGKAEAYYIDYRGTAQEFVSTCRHGFLFQGQWSRWQRKRRGTPATDLPLQRFVIYLQNHDQVANSLKGQRLHQLTSPAVVRALTALTLLAPSIPMLFQGQEFAASAPFLYFADHRHDLGLQVAKGRREFLRQFRTIAAPDAEDVLPDPRAVATFERCKLDFSERLRNHPTYLLHQDLLRLRRDHAAFRLPALLDGATLGERAFVLRFFGRDGDDRLLIVNLGSTLYFDPAPEPLLAPPEGLGWRLCWSSETPAYGGGGSPPVETQSNWIISGPAAFVLSPEKNRELPRAKISEAD